MKWLNTILLLSLCTQLYADNSSPLVSLADYDDSIVINMRYATTDNFTGRVIDGYQSNTCLLTEPAAHALTAVAHDLQQQSSADQQLRLIVYDCYRPQRAVDDFVRWASQPQDTVNKAQYYPRVAKNQLFEQGYIAKKSGHSRGSTVDLSLLVCDDSGCEPLDMGTDWDYLDPLAATETTEITTQQQANRLLLRSAMDARGFSNYSKEWWHYTLRDEPYPDTYFNIPIKQQ